MQVIGLLLLMVLLQGGSCMYCTEQRGNVHVEETGSVTISCNFTYPQRDPPVEVRVSWRQEWRYRCSQGPIIYNHIGGWTHDNYTGRISPVGDPNTEGRATIIIRDLRRTDGPMFCCRVEIYEGSRYIEGWQNPPGTSILFKDDLSVEQADVVPAVIGEDIIIPCLVHYKYSYNIRGVTWTVGDSDLCSQNNEQSVIWNEENKSQIRGRWSVVNFPQNLSLRIIKGTLEDNKRYCCGVRTRIRSNSLASPIRGTEVVVVAASNNPGLAVQQPKTMTADKNGSVTLSCTFSYQRDVDPLWIEVFWRAGSPTGIYAYHPFTNMVHPSYRGRTERRGAADLHIQSVTDMDNTTYYCFVMLKICINNSKTSSTIQYGGGTELDVKGLPHSKTWIYVVAAVLPAVIILCVVLFIILKKKGTICQKGNSREDIKYLTSDIALRDQNPSSNVQTPRASASHPPVTQEDSGGLLYAHLNMPCLEQKTINGGKGSKPDNDSQVLYAAVKPSAAPQDIYSTVKK